MFARLLQQAICALGRVCVAETIVDAVERPQNARWGRLKEEGEGSKCGGGVAVALEGPSNCMSAFAFRTSAE
jgi:hypothetical protein